MVKSRLKKSARKCPFECGGGCNCYLGNAQIEERLIERVFPKGVVHILRHPNLGDSGAPLMGPIPLVSTDEHLPGDHLLPSSAFSRGGAVCDSGQQKTKQAYIMFKSRSTQRKKSMM